MSILIKGMEMPKDNDALFHIRRDGTAALYPFDGKSEPQEYKFISVPPHGDLIDRDKLEKDIDKYIGGEESRSRFHHWVQVQDAVIPMDKGEEK